MLPLCKTWLLANSLNIKSHPITSQDKMLNGSPAQWRWNTNTLALSAAPSVHPSLCPCHILTYFLLPANSFYLENSTYGPHPPKSALLANPVMPLLYLRPSITPPCLVSVTQTSKYHILGWPTPYSLSPPLLSSHSCAHAKHTKALRSLASEHAVPLTLHPSLG